MRIRRLSAAGFVVLFVAWAASVVRGDDAADVLLDDAPRRDAAIARLRAEGPPALARLVERWNVEQRRLSTEPENADVSKSLDRLDRAIDAVGGARHSRQAGLFWHADLEQAKSVARQEGKPILYLRLLGALTDDYSCANSRFFRAMLYPNAEVSKYLRENYVLCWKTWRPAPRITIDFGDGRKLERTITGNSVHYVLAADGTVLDALPGVYGPQAFLEHLRRNRRTSDAVARIPEAARAEFLRQTHREALDDIAARWRADLADVAGDVAANEAASGDAVPVTRPAAFAGTSTGVPAATQGESLGNGPEALRRLVDRAASARVAASPVSAAQEEFTTLERRTTDEAWEKIAARHAVESRIDDASRAVIASHNPTAAQAGRLALTKRVVEDPLLRVVRNFERTISLDSVRNEYQMHRKIHAWLGEQTAASADVERFNEQVYEHLFLMPGSDPWLGLAPPDVYSALPNAGVVVPAKR